MQGSMEWWSAYSIEQYFNNLNFMTATKWLALPEGTKVRMTCDHGDFKNWDIITREKSKADWNYVVGFFSRSGYHYLQDDQWELIEEPTKLPTQWEMIEVRSVYKGTTSTWDKAMFVCFFLEKPLVKFDDDTFDVLDEWRYQKQKTELTLAQVEEKLGLEKDSLIIKE